MTHLNPFKRDRVIKYMSEMSEMSVLALRYSFV